MIVGICGRAGSGKDTIAGFLVESGYLPVSFSTPMKEFCKEVFDFSDEQLYGPSECRNGGDPRYVRPDGTMLSPREALQKLGTDWGRACYPQVWVELALRRARDVEARTGRRAVISDVRFENEARAIVEAGGRVLKVERPGQLSPNCHISEMGIDAIPPHLFSAVLVNDGTLEDLKIRVFDWEFDTFRQAPMA